MDPLLDKSAQLYFVEWNGTPMEGGEGKSAEYPILPTTFYLTAAAAAVATSDLKEGREEIRDEEEGRNGGGYNSSARFFLRHGLEPWPLGHCMSHFKLDGSKLFHL